MDDIAFGAPQLRHTRTGTETAMQDMRALLELLTMLVTDPRTGILTLLLAVAAISDCRSYRIPNWLTFGGAACGLLYSAAVPFSPGEGMLWSLGGLLLGMAIVLPLYMLQAMGAGDVKLIAMTGSFLGLSHIGYTVICIFIAGGIAALGFTLYRRAAGRMLGNIQHSMQLMLLAVIGGAKPSAHIDTAVSAGRMPYAVSIAIGTIGYLVVHQLGYL
jgi:prepilin peptidase CpaA